MVMEERCGGESTGCWLYIDREECQGAQTVAVWIWVTVTGLELWVLARDCWRLSIRQGTCGTC